MSTSAISAQTSATRGIRVIVHLMPDTGCRDGSGAQTRNGGHALAGPRAQHLRQAFISALFEDGFCLDQRGKL
jgi:hypothetical protein